MNLAVFGATGRVGRRILEYAARDGHRVTALVRDPARLAGSGVAHTVSGDVTDPMAVRATIEGTDAVLSALGGAGLANPGKTLSEGMRVIVQEMTRAGVSRILAVAGSGVLDGSDGRLRSEAPGFPQIYAAITREHLGTWNALKSSQLHWTLVCCPDLVEGELTGSYRVSPDTLPKGGRSISVEDTADFMLRQIGMPTYVGKRVGIADGVTASAPAAS
jgi:putative NADH-flavin reductase